MEATAAATPFSARIERPIAPAIFFAGSGSGPAPIAATRFPPECLVAHDGRHDCRDSGPETRSDGARSPVVDDGRHVCVEPVIRHGFPRASWQRVRLGRQQPGFRTQWQ